MSIIALIPARAGSVRIPGKNMKLLAGHPLIAYTIAAAKQSGIFEAIVVSSDDRETIRFAAESRGATPHIRPKRFATNESPDIEWVREYFETCYPNYCADCFAILRPTSPFRTANTILRAWERFRESDYDSIRAVEPVKQHPAKMWTIQGYGLRPFYSPLTNTGAPAHSSPTQTLPTVYAQNASLEMARRSVIDSHSITGAYIGPFLTQDYEGFDLNTMDDWQFAEMKIASGDWKLPSL